VAESEIKRTPPAYLEPSANLAIHERVADEDGLERVKSRSLRRLELNRHRLLLFKLQVRQHHWLDNDPVVLEVANHAPELERLVLGPVRSVGRRGRGELLTLDADLFELLRLVVRLIDVGGEVVSDWARGGDGRGSLGS
jgi:hypothetical protein